MEINQMTEQQLLDEASRRGYTIRDAPRLAGVEGKRIGGAHGPDDWQNKANNRLYEIQISR